MPRLFTEVYLKLFKIRPKDREPKAGARVREQEKEVRGFRGMS